MLWLGLHYPALGLEVFELSMDAQSEGLPRVLVEQGQVVLCNSAAARLGISPGVTAATANTISTGVTPLQRAPERELLRLQSLAESLYQLTPLVAIEPPAGLLLEISASLRLFGSAQALAQQAIRLSAELGHTVNACLAPTPAAALALAATGADRLEQVPLSALGIDQRDVERLVNMGLQYVQDVAHLPAKELAQRFGIETLRQLQRLTGQQSDPKAFIRLSAQFKRTLELLDPIHSKQGLQFPMQRLAEELKHWLISQQLAVGQLRWQFASAAGVHSAAKIATVIADFAQPHQNPEKMLQISRLRLDQTELPADVLSVSVEAVRLSACQPAATDLFDRRQAAGSQNMLSSTPTELLDQLRARLGNAACRQLEAINQHHPAWLSRQPVTTRFMQMGKERARQPSTILEHALPARQRPLWLRNAPQPVAFNALRLLHGPERIRTAWWRNGICRDYYIAHYRSESYCWAFTDDSGNWFVHGYFA